MERWKFITNFYISEEEFYLKACQAYNSINPNSVSVGRSSFGVLKFTKGLWRNTSKEFDGFWKLFDDIKVDANEEDSLSESD